jgi:hypothetical protein
MRNTCGSLNGRWKSGDFAEKELSLSLFVWGQILEYLAELLIIFILCIFQEETERK